MTEGTLVVQTLERPLRPGEVSLDELERAFRETEIEVAAPAPVAKPLAAAPAAVPTEAAKKPARKAAAEDVVQEATRSPTSRSGSMSTPSNTS